MFWKNEYLHIFLFIYTITNTAIYFIKYKNSRRNIEKGTNVFRRCPVHRCSPFVERDTWGIYYWHFPESSNRTSIFRRNRLIRSFVLFVSDTRLCHYYYYYDYCYHYGHYNRLCSFPRNTDEEEEEVIAISFIIRSLPSTVIQTTRRPEILSVVVMMKLKRII